MHRMAVPLCGAAMFCFTVFHTLLCYKSEQISIEREHIGQCAGVAAAGEINELNVFGRCRRSQGLRRGIVPYIDYVMRLNDDQFVKAGWLQFLKTERFDHIVPEPLQKRHHMMNSNYRYIADLGLLRCLGNAVSNVTELVFPCLLSLFGLPFGG